MHGNETNDSSISVIMSPLLHVNSGGPPKICMGAKEVVIAFVLVVLMFFIIAGNVLVILSVCLYRRMQSFTNVLLVSLSTADLLVGLLILPASLVYLLEEYWRFGRFLCQIWATLDVLLCTASIINLCVISLDRYFAISWPLIYIRKRSKKFALLLVCAVWFVALLVCIPPWFVTNWGFADEDYQCGYVWNIAYRIYSACGSFYFPLLVMLFVYYKIFRITRNREAMLNVGKRGSHLKIHRGGGNAALQQRYSANMALNPLTSALAISGVSANLPSSFRRSSGESRRSSAAEYNSQEQDFEGVISMTADPSARTSPNILHGDLSAEIKRTRVTIAEDEDTIHSLTPHTRSRIASKTYEYFINSNPIRAANKEKNIYMKEHKALKTIGIVVTCFVGCWLPFFVLYILESACQLQCQIPSALSNFCLWLGYSNSVFNPLIYACYNRDFRRCFEDLLSGGCLRRKVDRRMSVKRLYQVRRT